MTTVATSTMESEYMSAYPYGQEVIFIRNLLEELGLYSSDQLQSL